MSVIKYDIRTGARKIKTRTAIAVSALGLGAAGVAGSAAILGTAHAANTTTTVTPSNFSTIFSKTDVRPDSSSSFTFGPATPPLGSGSLELTTNDGAGKQQYLELQQFGTALSDIDSMSYSTYRHADSTGSSVQVPAINMEIDYNGSALGGFATLVFEPAYNTDQGTIQNSTWQNWDAFNSGNAVWWSSKDIPGVCAFNCFVKWSDILSSNPDAVLGDYGINQGSGNPGIHANVDALSIGVSGDVTTYDFEKPVAAGTITSPTAGEHVSGTLVLGATYDDGDVPNTDDTVQWAVRYNTCAASTNTVYGNVDGHSDPYSWDGNTYSATFDVRNATPGLYCFVFNPKDDAGQPDVRLTREFYIDQYYAQSKDDCKNNGWTTLHDSNGNSFKNQGDCVSYVATGGKNMGSVKH